MLGCMEYGYLCIFERVDMGYGRNDMYGRSETISGSC